MTWLSHRWPPSMVIQLLAVRMHLDTRRLHTNQMFLNRQHCISRITAFKQHVNALAARSGEQELLPMCPMTVRHGSALTMDMCAQELRKELEKEKEEHAAAAAKGVELQQQTEQLTDQKKVLEEIQKELNCENAELRQRAEALADSAEMLLSEKHNVQNEVDQSPQHADQCVNPGEEAKGRPACRS